MTPETVPPRTAVIGAGMAGLTCAAALRAAGGSVTVFDKARGPGGRMSTRRLALTEGEVTFDHGAPVFTARDPGFRAQVALWTQAGLVAPWSAAGEGAFVGAPAMNAPLKAVAAGLEIRCGVTITGLARIGDGWVLEGPDESDLAYDRVVLAVPAEQAAVLLVAANDAFAALARSTVSAPCWSLMLVFSRPIETELRVLDGDEVIGRAFRDGHKPGRSGGEAWVIQASSTWSRDNLEAGPSDVATWLLAAFETRMPTPLPPLLSSVAHRWRYAQPEPLALGALWDPAAGLGVCGDWLDGGDVEGAWRSGARLAAQLNAADARP